MLKRTMGRSLLTLLVVTGLAGTINDSSISKKDRKAGVSFLKETRDDAVNVVKGLSDKQLRYKSAAGKWSVKDCMFHIAGAEKMLWTLFENSMQAPANPEKRTEIKFTDEQVVNLAEDRSAKLQAPQSLQPANTGFGSMEQALEDFKKNRGEHIKYLKNSTEDLRNHVIELPIGYVDGYQLLLFMAAYSSRHTLQIKEVKTDPGFPAN
jgi:uncharacterized damage-inducible protein DinB